MGIIFCRIFEITRLNGKTVKNNMDDAQQVLLGNRVYLDESDLEDPPISYIIEDVVAKFKENNSNENAKDLVVDLWENNKKLKAAEITKNEEALLIEVAVENNQLDYRRQRMGDTLRSLASINVENEKESPSTSKEPQLTSFSSREKENRRIPVHVPAVKKPARSNSTERPAVFKSVPIAVTPPKVRKKDSPSSTRRSKTKTNASKSPVAEMVRV